MPFSLDSQLEKDTLQVCDLGTCKLLLMNDSRYLWLILVPQIKDAIELHLLEKDCQDNVFHEMMQIANIIGGIEGIDKINIGAIGNVVSQLHIHIIGRNKQDETWPMVVWGNGIAQPYDDKVSEKLIALIKEKLALAQ